MIQALKMMVLKGGYGICRLNSDAPIPDWLNGEGLAAITRTDEELSLVCPAERIPGSILSEKGWRALKVAGPLDFAMVGVLADISSVLAQAGISIFVISTYDTDYIFVKEPELRPAVAALTRAGHRITWE